MEERELTYGEKAVGVRFNVGWHEEVNWIKRACADLIDELNRIREEAGRGEKGRMLSLAITELQAAQMWAVKAVTWEHD
jgi:hypothetical protein